MSQQQSNTNSPIDGLRSTYPDYVGQVRHTKRISGQDAQTVPADDVVRSEIADQLPHDSLFTHQRDALDVLELGNNVCVATSTSSGKTLIYALQIARNHLENEHSKSLLLYPTKVLSRDQEQTLNDLYNELGLDISVRVYDGDTSKDRRKRIRRSADVIITNFSGLNAYLPSHSLWSQFFADLELVAIDESHSYTGVHGMHVAYTIRRLRRVLDVYDANPQFTLTSATIGNPKEHSERLTGVDVSVVDTDGSPSGQRDIGFWQPPIEHGDDGQIEQRPAGQEASELLAHLAHEGLQSLLFTRSRKQTELNAERARSAAADHPSHTSTTIKAYNAGRGETDRRGVENMLRDGEVDGVVTTNALERGINIGGLDATIVSGYPQTRQSFWQQLGRAGRDRNSALGIFVAQHDSIDQYILNNPEYLLDDSNIEDAVIDLENNVVFARHLLCASQEVPLTHADAEWFDLSRMKAASSMYKDAGLMVGSLDGGIQYNGMNRPQDEISMYATSDEQFDIRCDEQQLEMEPIDKQRAYRDFHEGAIVLHKGEQYQVVEFTEETPQPYVTLQPVNVAYYTQPLRETRISNVQSKESRTLADGVTLHRGTGTVGVDYTGYKKKKLSTNNDYGMIEDIDLPPIEMETQLMWVEFTQSVIEMMTEEYENSGPSDNARQTAVAGGLHALEHGVIGLAPLELRMDKTDLGGLAQAQHPELNGNGAFFIYDGVSGGIGFSTAIYDNFDSIFSRVEEMIATCDCTTVEGCPACVVEYNCGANNEPMHTDCALALCDIINQT